MKHNFVLQLTCYPFQDKINNYHRQYAPLDTVQIRSRPESHSDTHSKTPPDTVQIRSRLGSHSDTHSDSTFGTIRIGSRHGSHSDVQTYKLHLNKNSRMASTSPSLTRFYHLSKWHLLSPFPTQSTSASSSANFWAL